MRDRQPSCTLPLSSELPSLIEVRLTVPPEHNGWRLDHFIKARIPRLSRNRIQQMIRSQEELCGRVLRPSCRVRAAQELVLLRPRPVEPDVPRHFRVLYADAALTAIEKPSGLPVHATARFHRNTLTSLLREHYGDQGTPVLAHRLDRETSGVMLLGMTRAAGIALKAAFRDRLVEKSYLAICHGHAPPCGVINHPIGPDLRSGIRVKMGVSPGGMPASTVYRTLAHRAGFSLVQALPTTGRQHQIRVHLDAIGHPLVGDKLYGQGPDLWLEFLETGYTESLAERLLLPRQALHAATICFPHPDTRVRMTVECPLDAELQRFWDSLEHVV